MSFKNSASCARVLLAIVLSSLLLVQAVLCRTTQVVFDVGSVDTNTDDILEAAHNASVLKTCTSCQALLLPLKRLAALGDKAFVSSMVRICKTRKVRGSRHFFSLRFATHTASVPATRPRHMRRRHRSTGPDHCSRVEEHLHERSHIKAAMQRVVRHVRYRAC